MTSDFRLVAATNRDLRAMVTDRSFARICSIGSTFFRSRPSSARAPRRYPAAGALLRPGFRRPHAQADRRDPRRSHGGAGELHVAGQHPRTAQRGRTVCYPYPGKRLDPQGRPEPSGKRPPAWLRMAEAERRHILEALDASNWVVGGPKGAANARIEAQHAAIQDGKPGDQKTIFRQLI